MKIGVFDSGVGGLTVYRAVVVARPDADFTYVADDAGFPYGALADPKLVERVTGLFEGLIATQRPLSRSPASHRCQGPGARPGLPAR